MVRVLAHVIVIAVLTLLTTLAAAAADQSPVPRLVKFSGVVPGGAGTVEVTYALYAEQGSETPLWSETQRVTLDESGRYAVLLGASRPEGLPPEVFASGEARWLGVRVAGQAELQRVALVSVPYALKAADAETVGGRPLSAFVLAGDKTGVGADGLTYVDTRVLKQGLSAAGSAAQGAGTPGYLGVFTSPTELGSSVIFQNGASIGVGTTAPAAAFHAVATTAPGALFDVYSNALVALPVVYRAARGTPAAPSAVQTDDILGGLAVRGYGATGFTSGRGQVMFRAAENWTDAANGTYLQFTTTQTGTTTWVERMRITPRGLVGIGTPDPKQELTVNGTIESLSGGFVFPDGTRQTTAGMAIGSNAAFGTESLSRNTSGLANTAFGQYSLAYNTTGTSNTAVGYLSLQLTTTGGGNTAVGEEALRANTTGYANVSVGHRGLYQNTTGDSNTAVGYYSLSSNTSGYRNVAVGSLALGTMWGGTHNTAVGHMSLRSAALADYNTSVGAFSLLSATSGTGNSAFGFESLRSSLSGSSSSAFGYRSLAADTVGENSAFGYESLTSSTTGTANSAFGHQSLRTNTTGYSSSAFGYQSLYSNTIGASNQAFGYYALRANVSGDFNSAFGQSSLHSATGDYNSAYGHQTLYQLTTGLRNTAVGAHAGNGIVTGSDNTFIGYAGGTTLSYPGLTNATAIGAYSSVQQNYTVVLGGIGLSQLMRVGINTPAPDQALQVVGNIKVGTVGTNGCVMNYGGGVIAGSCSSDVRLKKDIQPFGPVLDRLVRVRPVHFTWRAAEFPEYRFGRGINAGLIAQDVEKVLPEMVTTDENGFKQVNYSELPLVTLAAVRELKAENDALRAQLAAVLERLAKLEKVVGSRR